MDLLLSTKVVIVTGRATASGKQLLKYSGAMRLARCMESFERKQRDDIDEQHGVHYRCPDVGAMIIGSSNIIG